MDNDGEEDVHGWTLTVDHPAKDEGEPIATKAFDADSSPRNTSRVSSKAVSFDLFKADGFDRKGRAPPRTLLDRLNCPVAPSVQELRAQRAAQPKDPKANVARKECDETEQISRLTASSSSREQGQQEAAVSSGTMQLRTLPEPSSGATKKDVTIGVGVGIEDQPSIPVGPPPELSEEQRKDAATLIALFGEDVLRGAYSPKWTHRLDALKEVANILPTHASSPSELKAKVYAASVEMATLLLRDSVLQVYLQAVEVVRTLTGSFAADVDGAVVRAALKPGVRVLLQRIGDLNSRVSVAAGQLLTDLAAVPVVGVGFLGALVTEPEPAESVLAFKPLIARIQLLLTLIKTYGFDEDGGVSAEEAMALVAGALDGGHPQVRKHAAQVAVEAYRRLGRRAEAYLRGCKPATLKFLKTEIEVELSDTHALEDVDIRTQEEEDLVQLEPLEEQDQRKMRPLIEVFGPGIQCLVSKNWKLRLHALERLRQQLEMRSLACFQMAGTPPTKAAAGVRKAFSHCCRVLLVGLNDPVPAVYATACRAVISATEAYSDAISAADFRSGLEDVLPLLVGGAGDAHTAVKAASVETLSVLARQKEIGLGAVAAAVLQPAETLTQWRALVARLELLKALVEEFGFESGGLSCEATMEFAVSTFESPNAKVRRAAVALVLEVYQRAGNVVLAHLRNQKPALVNELKEKIMKIARKDRTRSAPIQRLANIVQPLCTEEASRSEPVRRRPKTFPTDLGDLDAVDTMSVRERVETWKKERQLTQGVHVAYKEDGVVVVAQAKAPKPKGASLLGGRTLEALAGPGMNVASEGAHGVKKKSTIRGRMVFES